MMREGSGNLLRADVDALVNTVNTVGVMGKGIALQFKRAYPDMFTAYAKAAKAGNIQLGRMHVWETHAFDGPRFVINFPTKRHWRGPSKIDYVRAGLDDLARVIRERGIKSVAVPPLGCGNGGLDWAQVRPLIEESLGAIDGVDVLLFPPAGAPPAPDMPDNRPRRRMTPGRAAMLAMMGHYQERTYEAPSVIEVQKLMYFLQFAGEKLRLNFVKGHYGPYADNLRVVLSELEGQYLVGFGDGSRKVNEAEPLRLLPGYEAEIEAALADQDTTRERMNRVLQLAEGFETAYGLELLSSTHWIAQTEPATADDPVLVAAAIRKWTQRKAQLFTPQHVKIAWAALQRDGWLRPSPA